MWWLVFDTQDGPCVVLQPAMSLLFARLAATTAHDLDPQSFREGHKLDAKTIKKVPKTMIGKCLSGEQANQLLKKLAG